MTSLAGHDDEQLAFRPQADSWSLLEVAYHLFLTEREAGKALAAGTAPPGSNRGLVPRLRFALLRLVLQSPMRVKVPVRRVLPKDPPPPGELGERWAELHRSLAERLRDVDRPSAREAAARHPVGGPMNLLQGLDFLRWHFDHHLRQVRRIRRAPDFPRRD